MRTIVVVMLALALTALANAAPAFDPDAPCSYVDHIEWQHWGGAKYGPTAEEALTDPKLDWYLKCSTAIPAELKAKVKETVRANPKGEKTEYLTPDMTVLEMASGPDHSHPTQHLMRNVKVARIIVAFGIVRAAETPTWYLNAADGSTVVVGDPFLCGNLSVIRIIPAPPKPPAAKPPARPTVPVAAGACPEGWRLVGNVWSLESLPDAIRKRAEELIAAADGRDSRNATNAEAYKPDDFSRTLGGQLRREVKTRAVVNLDVQVRLRDPQTAQVVQRLDAMKIVDGMGSIVLSDEQHLKIVETIWPGRSRSPTVSGGERRLWFFPYEWGNKCEMNEHAALP